MLQRGFLTSTQLFLFLSHTAEHVQSYLSAMDEVFVELEKKLADGSLADVETGGPANTFARLV